MRGRNGSLGRCCGVVLVHGVGLWIFHFPDMRELSVRAYWWVVRPCLACVQQWPHCTSSSGGTVHWTAGVSHKSLETAHRTEAKKTDKNWLLKLLALDYRWEPLPSWRRFACACHKELSWNLSLKLKATFADKKPRASVEDFASFSTRLCCGCCEAHGIRFSSLASGGRSEGPLAPPACRVSDAAVQRQQYSLQVLSIIEK